MKVIANMSNYEPIQAKETIKKKSNKPVIIGVLASVFIACILLFSLIVSAFSDVTTPSKPFSSGYENVTILHVDGTIGEDEDYYNQEWITSEIKRAELDKDNRAIVLKINSPGGSAYDSDETYLNLMDYKKKTGRPIAYAEDLMASGGYYIAAASDEIYANRNSLIGSIGVIGFQSVDASALLNKLGVKVTTVHSGKDKLVGALSSELTADQKAQLQAITDECYEQFVGIVAKSRKMSFEQAKTLATGGVYSAKQAKKNGLINDIMRYEEFLDFLKSDKDLMDYEFNDVYYEKSKDSFLNYVKYSSLFGKNELTSSLEALKALEMKRPMYLYQG